MRYICEVAIYTTDDKGVQMLRRIGLDAMIDARR